MDCLESKSALKIKSTASQFPKVADNIIIPAGMRVAEIACLSEARLVRVGGFESPFAGYSDEV